MSATRSTLRIALRNLSRQRTRSVILLGALALFVGLCVSLDAFASGFYRAMTEVAVGQTLGEVQVHAPDHLPARTLDATLPGPLTDRVRRAPGVRVVAPRIRVPAMVDTRAGARPIDLIGAEPPAELAFGSLADLVTEGRFVGPDEPAALVLPARIAASLHAVVGDEIALTAGTAAGAPRNAAYVLVGTFDDDASRVGYVSLAALREHVGLAEGVVTELAVRTAAGVDPEDAARTIAGLCDEGECVVETWDQRAPALAAAMTTDHDFLRATYGLFVLIAGLMVLNLQLMAVLERTRELGMLLALGVTPRRLMAMLTLEAAALGLLGIATGLGLAALAVAVMSGGVDIAAMVADAGTVAGVAIVPIVFPYVDTVVVTSVCVGIFVMTVLAAVGPSLRLRTMNPVVAMRADG